MIADPINDRQCLGRMTELARTLAASDDPAVVELAQRFPTTRELVEWIRALPQRDDLGDPKDGPRVDACEPPQRLNLFNDAPNCVERTNIYVVAAEKIDPRPVRRMMTVDLPNGRHTLPMENGVPVVLDPRVTRNAINAALFRSPRARNCGPAVELSPEEAIDWIGAVAQEPAGSIPNGVARVRRGHAAMRGVLRGRAICVAELPDVALTLALANREAPLYGNPGRRIVWSTLHAIDRLDQLAAGAAIASASGDTRNAGLELRIGNTTIAPDWNVLGALGRVAGRLGGEIATTALQAKLATLGITPPLLTMVEHELNQEGLTLGALGRPAPLLGSLDALRPQALAGRWLASKV